MSKFKPKPTSKPTAWERFAKIKALKKNQYAYFTNKDAEFLVSLVEAAVQNYSEFLAWGTSEDKEIVLKRLWQEIEQRMAEGEGK